jgi:hypothetical protein
MGNLARATFEKTTTVSLRRLFGHDQAWKGYHIDTDILYCQQYIWPWSYDKCGAIDHLEEKQEISACTKSPGFGLHPHQGRGAPEIGTISCGVDSLDMDRGAEFVNFLLFADIFEVMPGHEMPGAGNVTAFMSSSLQVSPGLSKASRRPRNGYDLNSSDLW